jgi:hypothetical protein
MRLGKRKLPEPKSYSYTIYKYHGYEKSLTFGVKYDIML